MVRFLFNIFVFFHNIDATDNGCMVPPGGSDDDANGGCSHLCLPLAQSSICACPDDRRLESDGHTCTTGKLRHTCTIVRYHKQIMGLYGESIKPDVKPNWKAVVNFKIKLY